MVKDVSAAQVRAGRTLLGWSRERLAEAAEVGLRTLVDYESGARTPYPRTLRAIVDALETGGVNLATEPDGTLVVKLRPGASSEPGKDGADPGR